MQKNTTDKYLTNYAESEAKNIAKIKETYKYVVVIPICNERVDVLKSIFLQINKNQSVLVILVVNSPANHVKSFKWCKQNALFINKIKKNINFNYKLSNNIELIKTDEFFDTIIVDRNSQGRKIDKDQGVGLARKIGCDIALKYYKEGTIECPFVFSTDADVILPDDYFKHVNASMSDYSAIVLDFEHFSDDALLKQLQFYYDFKIRYYHAGITYAGSKYDYIPLGSTLIASFDCYAKVRGFPKKNAGEDFYLLNKLAKIKPVFFMKHCKPIKIKSRFSDRVPFGTGPALMKINALDNIDGYLYYHPKSFDFLKQWIDFLNQMWSENKFNIERPKNEELSNLFDFFNCQIVFEKSQNQITSKKRWTQFVHQWFDAFKTLKAIHFFDQNLKKHNLKQLLKLSEFDKVTNLSLSLFLENHDKN